MTSTAFSTRPLLVSAVGVMTVLTLQGIAQAAPSEDSVPLMGKIGEVLTLDPTSFGDRTSRSSAREVRNRTYQLGDEWGKQPVTDAVLRSETPAFQRAARAAARAGGATAFFLGEFEGQLVVATNHHVFSDARSCLDKTIRFPLLKISATCSRFLGTWDSVDLSLFVITLDRPEQKPDLLAVGANFDFSSPITQAQQLLTIGFGIANNPQQQLMANRDGDCKVFSPTDTFKLMPDPDALNPGTYDAWSFANGCDVSHGDSGSAMVDRRTGRPVGLIWTGKIPKSARVQQSVYLTELLETQHPEIWTELSYAVPASKIRDVLQTAASDASTDLQDRQVFSAILSN